MIGTELVSGDTAKRIEFPTEKTDTHAKSEPRYMPRKEGPDATETSKRKF